jgi:hypothetical protein
MLGVSLPKIPLHLERKSFVGSGNKSHTVYIPIVGISAYVGSSSSSSSSMDPHPGEGGKVRPQYGPLTMDSELRKENYCWLIMGLLSSSVFLLP